MSIRARLCVPAVALLAGLAGAAGAAEPKADPAAVEFFEKKVRPVLVARCYECHSTGKKRRGGERQ